MVVSSLICWKTSKRVQNTCIINSRFVDGKGRSCMGDEDDC